MLDLYFLVQASQCDEATLLHRSAVHLDLPMWGQMVGIPQNGIFPVGIELSSIVGM